MDFLSQRWIRHIGSLIDASISLQAPGASHGQSDDFLAFEKAAGKRPWNHRCRPMIPWPLSVSFLTFTGSCRMTMTVRGSTGRPDPHAPAESSSFSCFAGVGSGIAASLSNVLRNAPISRSLLIGVHAPGLRQGAYEVEVIVRERAETFEITALDAGRVLLVQARIFVAHAFGEVPHRRHRCPIRWAGIRTRVPRTGVPRTGPDRFSGRSRSGPRIPCRRRSGGLRRRTVRQPMTARRIPMPRRPWSVSWRISTSTLPSWWWPRIFRIPFLVPDVVDLAVLERGIIAVHQIIEGLERGYARAFAVPSAYASERDQRVASHRVPVRGERRLGTH